MTIPSAERGPAHLFRLAQARRLLRFCGDSGLDPHAVIEGLVAADLSSICDGGGVVIPDAADLAAVQRLLELPF